MKIQDLIRISIALALLALLQTSQAFGDIKYRHVLSIYADEKNLALHRPEGVACNDASLIVVSDSGNGRLLRYSFENETLKPGVVEIRIPGLPYPERVQMNSKGHIYALDTKARRIIHLGPDGGFQGFVDPKGIPSSAPYVPKSLSIDRHDNLYILDILSARVIVLGPDGRYLQDIPFPGEYGFFSDLAVDIKGSILLLDSVHARVFSAARDSRNVVPLTGNLKEYMRFPTAIATDGRGRIFLTDRNGGTIVTLGQDGSFMGRISAMGWKEGRLSYPSQLCINSNGQVFIADTNNNRIEIFAITE